MSDYLLLEPRINVKDSTRNMQNSNLTKFMGCFPALAFADNV